MPGPMEVGPGIVRPRLIVPVTRCRLANSRESLHLSNELGASVPSGPGRHFSPPGEASQGCLRYLSDPETAVEEPLCVMHSTDSLSSA